MSRKGRLKPEDEKVIRENIIFLKEQLDAKYLVDFLFQYNVISLDDVINIREDTSRVRRNEKLIELLLHSGPGDSFKYFLKSLERQYSHVLEHLKATASAPFNNLDLEADEEIDSVRSVRNTHNNTRNNASNVEQGISNAAAPDNYPDLQADAENNSVVSGRNTLDNIRNNASNAEQELGNASAPFNNLDLEADEETDSVRSVRNTHDNTRNNASNVEEGIANAAAPDNYPDLQADAENNSVVSGRNTLDNIRNNASNAEQELGNASAPFNNLDLEADEETDSVRSVRNTHDNTRNNASNVEEGIANAAAPINYLDLQADAENNSVVSGRNTLDNIRNNASNAEQELGNGNTNVTVKLESQEIKELLFGADGTRLPSGLKRIKTLGHGAYGSVFLETIQSSKGLTEIAVKQIHVQDATKKDKFEKSFKNETLALNQLTHERIVEFYGYISTDLTYQIFIEYLPGGSLSEYIDKMKIIAEEKARNLTRQILEGIAYIHRKMFFHRDIKSSNVLMSDENTVKLADFGLTREYEELTVSCTEGVGTYRFMAPEMLDKKYNKYVDIWALGCVVLHMLTGQYPFHELKEPQQVLKILIKNPLPLEGVSVQFSRKAKLFLENTFHLEPKSRPSADRLLEDPFITGN